MERTYKPLLMDSIKVHSNIKEQRFIGFDGNYCQAGAKALGVSDVDIQAEQYAPVALFGILLVKTGGAVAAGDKVTSDDNGKAVTVTGAEEINGYALDAAAGNNEIIRIAKGI